MFTSLNPWNGSIYLRIFLLGALFYQKSTTLYAATPSVSLFHSQSCAQMLVDFDESLEDWLTYFPSYEIMDQQRQPLFRQALRLLYLHQELLREVDVVRTLIRDVLLPAEDFSKSLSEIRAEVSRVSFPANLPSEEREVSMFTTMLPFISQDNQLGVERDAEIVEGVLYLVAAQVRFYAFLVDHLLESSRVVSSLEDPKLSERLWDMALLWKEPLPDVFEFVSPDEQYLDLYCEKDARTPMRGFDEASKYTNLRASLEDSAYLSSGLNDFLFGFDLFLSRFQLKRPLYQVNLLEGH